MNAKGLISTRFDLYCLKNVYALAQDRHAHARFLSGVQI